MRAWEFIEWVFFVFGGLLGVFILWLMLVMMPMSLRAESRCLAKGYPKATVTWDLTSYCMNMEGAVTVAVEALP